MLQEGLKTDERSSGPETWVDRHGDCLYRYALLRLRNEVAAEEIVQETFLAALKSYSAFDGKASERTWLIGILKHKIIDHFRRCSRQVSFDSLEGLPAESADLFQQGGEWVDHFDFDRGPIDWGSNPASIFETLQFQQTLQQCLARLPERLSAVFTLREMEELSSEDVCKVLDISTTNLWVMLHRARAHLRKCIEYNWFRKATG